MSWDMRWDRIHCSFIKKGTPSTNTLLSGTFAIEKSGSRSATSKFEPGHSNGATDWFDWVYNSATSNKFEIAQFSPIPVWRTLSLFHIISLSNTISLSNASLQYILLQYSSPIQISTASWPKIPITCLVHQNNHSQGLYLYPTNNFPKTLPIFKTSQQLSNIGFPSKRMTEVPSFPKSYIIKTIHSPQKSAKQKHFPQQPCLSSHCTKSCWSWTSLTPMASNPL